MSYTALYRKFRPITFSGVVGQDHIVKTLKNQMVLGKVSHAYLFCGTRGTGKTSTAKIFARAINCLHPTPEGEPCNECELCQSILEGRSVNVIEIDAASNNGVENIREIREEVQYAPTEGTYKVYIIDEVHMLTTNAFNALLKTLEEPPAHVIFLLATTDPQKIPVTIVSRCQRFDFRRISAQDIADTLTEYLQQEQIQAEPDAIDYIARLADGSLRDSLSLLDQCLAFFSSTMLTRDNVQEVMGAVDQSVFFALTTHLSQKNAAEIMQMIEQILILGRDLKQFVSDFLGHLRNVLIVHSVPESQHLLGVSDEQFEQLQQQSQKVSEAELSHWIRMFSSLQQELKYTSNARLPLEVLLLQLCSNWACEDITALAAKVAILERELEQGISVQPIANTKKETPKQKPQSIKKLPPVLEDFQTLRKDWGKIRAEISDVVLRGKLSSVELGWKNNDVLYLVCEYGALADMLERYIDQLTQLLSEHVGKEIKLETIEKAAYVYWQESHMIEEVYPETNCEPEFASLMSTYFPEADQEP